MDRRQVWRATLGELEISLSQATFETWQTQSRQRTAEICNIKININLIHNIISVMATKRSVCETDTEDHLGTSVKRSAHNDDGVIEEDLELSGGLQYNCIYIYY